MKIQFNLTSSNLIIQIFVLINLIFYKCSPHGEDRPKTNKTLFGPVNFQFLFKDYIKMN